ncbi:MAG: DUF2927 domain-containing protein [Pseudomonadota bacterium]
MRVRLGILTAACTAAMIVAGCQSTVGVSTTGAAATRAAPPGTTPAPLTNESRALSVYYQDVQDSLLSRGMLRTDGGGSDAPVSAAMLARNFERIAMYEEYAMVGGRMVAKQTPSLLHRWEEPVRLQLEFGGSVPQATRRADSRHVAGLVNRLARSTGHPISQVRSGGNFHVFVVSEHERRALVPRLKEIMPNIGLGTLKAVTRMPRSSYCLVFAYDPDNRGIYRQAVAVIRAEHPDLMRLSCYHEEIAQGLGLSNDSPMARPSIFNDDEEFGLLTGHDDMLLRMLYDRRLTPGMTPARAKPIVRQIAGELVASVR